MKIINKTPHKLNIILSSGEVLEILPSLPPIRLSVKSVISQTLENGLQIFSTEVGEIQDNVEPEEGTIFVVSGLVKGNAGRSDFASPGELVRDEKGNVIGCKGLSL